jgi:hypothetical protein
MGHSTIAMTMPYAHLAAGSGAQHIKVLDAKQPANGNLTATRGGLTVDRAYLPCDLQCLLCDPNGN